MLTKDIYELIHNELNWAEKNRTWPENLGEQSNKFSEEALEVIQAVNDFSEPEKKGNVQKIAKEAIQAITVLIRMLKGF